MFKRAVLVVGVALAAVSFGGRALAHDFTIDQRCEDGWRFLMAILHNDPLGQEFVPQMSSLDVVEVYMGIGSNPLSSATVAVRIRSQTIDGPVLATSNGVTFEYPSPISYRHFDFPSSVALIPGELYVIEVIQVAGTGNAYLAGTSNLYAPGRFLVGNQFSEAEDLIFREGPTLPLPTRTSTWGQITALYR